MSSRLDVASAGITASTASRTGPERVGARTSTASARSGGPDAVQFQSDRHRDHAGPARRDPFAQQFDGLVVVDEPQPAGLAPRRRPSCAGCTTTMLPSTQGPRQSVTRTGTGLPVWSSVRRSSARWPSWSTPGCRRRVPQQQPRHTSTRQATTTHRQLSLVRRAGPGDGRVLRLSAPRHP